MPIFIIAFLNAVSFVRLYIRFFMFALINPFFLKLINFLSSILILKISATAVTLPIFFPGTAPALIMFIMACQAAMLAIAADGTHAICSKIVVFGKRFTIRSRRFRETTHGCHSFAIARNGMGAISIIFNRLHHKCIIPITPWAGNRIACSNQRPNVRQKDADRHNGAQNRHRQHCLEPFFHKNQPFFLRQSGSPTKTPNAIVFKPKTSS